MTNAWEYREVMKAAMRYGETRTVEQVVADQKRKHDEADINAAAERMNKKGQPKADMKPAPSLTTVPKGEMDKLREMLANAPPRAAPADQLVSATDE